MNDKQMPVTQAIFFEIYNIGILDGMVGKMDALKAWKNYKMVKGFEEQIKNIDNKTK